MLHCLTQCTIVFLDKLNFQTLFCFPEKLLQLQSSQLFHKVRVRALLIVLCDVTYQHKLLLLVPHCLLQLMRHKHLVDSSSFSCAYIK